MNNFANDDRRSTGEVAAAAAALIRMLGTEDQTVRTAAEAALYPMILEHWEIVYAEMARARVRSEDPAAMQRMRNALRPREALRLVR